MKKMQIKTIITFLIIILINQSLQASDVKVEKIFIPKHSLIIGKNAGKKFKGDYIPHELNWKFYHPAEEFTTINNSRNNKINDEFVLFFNNYITFSINGDFQKLNKILSSESQRFFASIPEQKKIAIKNKYQQIKKLSLRYVLKHHDGYLFFINGSEDYFEFLFVKKTNDGLKIFPEDINNISSHDFEVANLYSKYFPFFMEKTKPSYVKEIKSYQDDKIKLKFSIKNQDHFICLTSLNKDQIISCTKNNQLQKSFYQDLDKDNLLVSFEIPKSDLKKHQLDVNNILFLETNFYMK